MRRNINFDMEILDTCCHVTGGLKNSESFLSLNQGVQLPKMGQNILFWPFFNLPEPQSSPITSKIGVVVEHFQYMCKSTSQSFQR